MNHYLRTNKVNESQAPEILMQRKAPFLLADATTGQQRYSVVGLMLIEELSKSARLSKWIAQQKPAKKVGEEK